MNIHKSLPAVVKIFHFSARRPSGRVSFCQPVKNIQETAKKVRGGRQTILQRIRYQTHSHQLSQHNVSNCRHGDGRHSTRGRRAPRAARRTRADNRAVRHQPVQCSAATNNQFLIFNFWTIL